MFIIGFTMLEHQVFESNNYAQLYGDEDHSVGLGQYFAHATAPAAAAGLNAGLASVGYDVATMAGLAGAMGPMMTPGMGGAMGSIPGSMGSMGGVLSSQQLVDDERALTANISPTSAIPESLHLNDEIFFNNNHYDQNAQIQPQSQVPHPDFVNSMASSSYSLQNYFSAAKSASPTSLASSTTSSTPSIANNSLATITTPDLSHSTDKATFPTLPTQYENHNNNFHQQLATPQYSYQQERHNSTSIPVDQLNLLSLKSMSLPGSGNTSSLSSDHISKSPSPDYYYAPNNNAADPNDYNYLQGVTANQTSSDELTIDPLANDSIIEERTINPSQLFASSKITTSLSTPSLSTLFTVNGVNPSNVNDFSAQNQNTHNRSQNFPDKNNIKLPSSVHYTNVPKLPNQSMPSQYKAADRSYKNPKFDFKMNDECYNAISYWLNNTLSTAKTEAGGYFEGDIPEEEGSDASTRIIVNPTGIIKGNINYNNDGAHNNHKNNRYSSFKRRNSIPLGNPSSYLQHSQKLHDVEDRQEEDEEETDNNQHDEDYMTSSTSTITGDQSAIPSAGQKKKRRKSTNTFDGSLSDLTSSVPTLFEGSPDISPTSSNIAVSDLNGHRSRKSSITKIMHSHKHNDSFKQDTTDSKVTKSKPAKSNSFSGASSVSSSSIPVVANAQGAFPCTECEKQFKRSEHLKRHIRSVHSNIRPFHCKYCEKKFSRSDNLAQHLKTHYRVDSLGQLAILYGNQTTHNRVAPGSRSRKDSISKT